MPPDVSTLKPSEARNLCRFCLQPQQPDTMQPPMVTFVDALATNDENNERCRTMSSWPDSEMGVLYAQLTGGEQVGFVFHVYESRTQTFHNSRSNIQLNIVANIVDDTDGSVVPPLSDGWCAWCPQRMRQAVDTLQAFREANAFWLRCWSTASNWSSLMRCRWALAVAMARTMTTAEWQRIPWTVHTNANR